jgi:hypothetical protein
MNADGTQMNADTTKRRGKSCEKSVSIFKQHFDDLNFPGFGGHL